MHGPCKLGVPSMISVRPGPAAEDGIQCKLCRRHENGVGFGCHAWSQYIGSLHPAHSFRLFRPAILPCMIMHTCGIDIISLPEYYCMILSKHRFLRNIASPVFFSLKNTHSQLNKTTAFFFGNGNGAPFTATPWRVERQAMRA